MGPPRPLPGGETPAELRKRLKDAVQQFEGEAPFTVQRLCELLLEPSKQYTRLDKLVRGLPLTLGFMAQGLGFPPRGARHAAAPVRAAAGA